MRTLGSLALLLIGARAAEVAVDGDGTFALATEGRLWTPDELSASLASDRLMLVVLGEVYDVKAGEKYYGEDGSYRVFVAQDSTRSFVSGNFSEDLASDDVSDFKPSECLGVLHWINFYRDHEVYRFEGRLIGRYYDAEGAPTEALEVFAACVGKGEEIRAEAKALDAIRPPCNSKWSAAEGGKVWCDEPKVPRKVPHASSGKLMCRCFDKEDAADDGGIRDDVEFYAGCDPESHMCRTTPPKEKAS